MDEQKVTEFDSLTENEDLDCLDQQIVNILLSKPAITDREIANELNLSRQTVNRRRNSDSIKVKLAAILSISEKRIRRLVALSLDNMESFLKDPDPRLRMTSSLAVLKLSTTLVTPTPTFSGFTIDLGGTEKSEEWIKDIT